MIKEYAIDPAVAADIGTLRVIDALFDYSLPRRISRFPKKWEKMVYQCAEGLDDLKKKRIEVKLQDLKNRKACLISSGRSYDIEKEWPQNAQEAHSEKAFHAIVCDFNNPLFVRADDVEQNHPLFALPNDWREKKTIENFNSLFKHVLFAAKEILIIDPYFDPTKEACVKLMKVWVDLLKNRPDVRDVSVSICTSSDNDRCPYQAGDEGKMLRQVNERLDLGGLKNNFSAKLAPNMHERYLLTDIASFRVDHSFSVDAQKYVNVNMISKETSDRVKAEYFGCP